MNPRSKCLYGVLGSAVLGLAAVGGYGTALLDHLKSTVALAEARARWTDTLRRVSDHEGQFGERVGKPGGRRHVGPEIVEA